jgi:hypothetical protein
MHKRDEDSVKCISLYVIIFTMKESLTNKQDVLDIFQAEIAALKHIKEKEGSASLEECNPTKLGEEDKKIYEKLKSNILTIEELREYQNRLYKSGNESQRIFAAYMVNMLSIEALAEYKQ